MKNQNVFVLSVSGAEISKIHVYGEPDSIHLKFVYLAIILDKVVRKVQSFSISLTKLPPTLVTYITSV